MDEPGGYHTKLNNQTGKDILDNLTYMLNLKQ